MKKNIEKELYRIAAFHSWAIENRGDLEYRGCNSEDCIELTVGAIQGMLEQAFELGRKTAELERKQNTDLKNQIFRQAFENYQKKNGGEN